MRLLVLASASAVRARLLHAAGITFHVDPAQIDEDAHKNALVAQGLDARTVAEALADVKALAVASRKPEAVVIGADQVLSLDGELVSKAPDLAAARAQLSRLRGRVHALITATSLALGDTVLWRHTAQSDLWVRSFSDAFLDGYLAHEGEAVLSSVGCYRLEGMGIQLFERIAGDYFSVLGLPLIPLLTALRDQGLIEP